MDNNPINFTAAAADLGGTWPPLVAAAGATVASGDGLFLPGPASPQPVRAGAAPQSMGDAAQQQPDLPGPLVGKKKAAPAVAPGKKKLAPVADLQDFDNAGGFPTHVDVLSTAALAAGVSSSSLNKHIEQQLSYPGDPGHYDDDAAAANNGSQTVNVDLDSATESNHDTALTLACAGGHEDLVNLLLNRGAAIGKSFFHLFFIFPGKRKNNDISIFFPVNRAIIIRIIILEKKVTHFFAEHRDKKGFTPLILAATAGHEKVVQILLDNNADIEAQSERTKDTPLSLACSGGRFEVVEVLLKKLANKEHRNVSDYTPLSLAASGGYVNIIKLLLAHGAEINSRTGSKLGISPLMLAAMNGHTGTFHVSPLG